LAKQFGQGGRQLSWSDHPKAEALIERSIPWNVLQSGESGAGEARGVSPTQKRLDERGSDASAPLGRNNVEFVEVRVVAHYGSQREADELIVGNGGYPEATASKTLFKIA
jgi:hypothetical protein